MHSIIPLNNYVNQSIQQNGNAYWWANYSANLGGECLYAAMFSYMYGGGGGGGGGGGAGNPAQAASGVGPAAVGRQGLQAAGITQNTTRISSLTGTAAYRVPDGLNATTRVLSEVKNVANLSYTNQLRDYVLWARANGYTFELWVRPTTTLSGPLQEAVANGHIVLRYLP
jgi:hypothetical protein